MAGKQKTSTDQWYAAQLRKWHREALIAKIKRLFGDKPRQYKHIPVPDWDKRTRGLSSFRQAYADFFRTSYYQENSPLQARSTQLLWHRLYLQKRRMERLGITLEMESQRVERTKNPRDSIVEVSNFDGRYEVRDVNEAIWSTRTFMKGGQSIGRYRDHDSVNYTILSAAQQGPDTLVCPNCGVTSTREDLIDGCDYCGTRFTVEDLEDRVDCFEFQIETSKKGLSDAARDARLSFDESAGKMVREFDPNFSFKSFRAGVFNKLAAIHFADDYRQISDFSDIDLSHLQETYKNVVNIDTTGLKLWDNRRFVESGLREKNDYYVEDGMQKLTCHAHLVLFVLVDGKLQLQGEVITLELEKYADCKTQNICGPSVFTCKGCGSSLSLLDGKSCPYCGRELDMRQYDWVITKYESKMAYSGKACREYN